MTTSSLYELINVNCCSGFTHIHKKKKRLYENATYKHNIIFLQCFLQIYHESVVVIV